MGFLDKAKEKASQLAEQAKDKIGDVKEKHKVDDLLDDLGRIVYRQRTERGEPGDEAEIVRLVGELRTLEAEGSEVLAAAPADRRRAATATPARTATRCAAVTTSARARRTVVPRTRIAANLLATEHRPMSPRPRDPMTTARNPTVVADLAAGETVLDLGSGGGIDVLFSARRVGPTGYVYGLDMTPQMLELARRNATEAGATNVEFLEGHIEAIPLPDASVDVIISNCVINLSPDKPAVFAEMHRVLRPGGRVGVSDVVTEDHLSAEQRLERGSYGGCTAGALPISEYESGLRDVGFVDVSITLTDTVGDGVHSAIVKATKPTSDRDRGEVGSVVAQDVGQRRPHGRLELADRSRAAGRGGAAGEVDEVHHRLRGRRPVPTSP